MFGIWHTIDDKVKIVGEGKRENTKKKKHKLR